MDNNKNIYDMLNDIEIDLDQYEKEDFTDIEKMKYKKNFRESTKTNTKYNNKNYKKYISAASVAIIALGIFSQTSLGVYAYSIVEDIVESMQSILGVDESLIGYSTNIDQLVTKRGLTIKIEEVLLDENELSVVMKYDYNKELNKGEIIELMRERLYINGKPVNYSADVFYSKIDTKNSKFVIRYDLGQNEYQGDIDVKIKFLESRIWQDIESDKYKRIMGPWVFKFTINGEKLKSDTMHIPINKDMKLDTGDEIFIEEYKENILSKRIVIKSKYIDISKMIVMKGRDNNGNVLEFTLDYINPQEIKDKDKVITYEFVYDKLMYDSYEGASKLYLTPYIIEEKALDKESVEIDPNTEYKKIISKYRKIGEEITINLDK